MIIAALTSRVSRPLNYYTESIKKSTTVGFDFLESTSGHSREQASLFAQIGWQLSMQGFRID